MQIIKYVCDRCKKYIPEKERVKIRAYAGEDFLSFSTDLDNADFCRSCFGKIQREIFQIDEPAVETPYPITITVPVAEEDPEPERIELPTKEDTEKPESEKKSGKKTWNMNKAQKEEVRRRYRAGEEMEAIADSMNIYLKPVNDLIIAEGLHTERYAGQKIPSNGGAPIPTCTVMGGTGKAKER